MRLPIAALVGAALMGLSSAAYAMLPPTDACAAYKNAVEGGATGAVPIVPDRLLVNWRDAVTCLVPIIGSLKAAVTSPKFSPEVQSKFLSATGAARAIMTRLSLAEDKLKGLSESERRGQDTLNDFIKLFRTLDSLDVIAVLTLGARSDNYDMRLNSVLLLSNVVDNQTVCVPLTHLNDPELDKTDYGVNGRANLLGIVSVVAPWAVRQNFDSIKATRDAVAKAAGTGNPNLKQTYALLENIQARLDSQTEANNKGANLPDENRRDCRKYIDDYRPKLPDTGNLKY